MADSIAEMRETAAGRLQARLRTSRLAGLQRRLKSPPGKRVRDGHGMRCSQNKGADEIGEATRGATSRRALVILRLPRAEDPSRAKNGIRAAVG